MSELEMTGVPRSVAARLQNLYRSAGDDLNERDVLADAEDAASPMHGYFEWDDTAAAHRWRIAQAQELIRRVRVTVTRDDAPPLRVRAWVAKRDLGVGSEFPVGSYAAIEDVAGVTAFEVSMRDAIARDLARLQRKYDNSELFFEVAAESLGGGARHVS
jgi:hypothetical protein